MSVLGDRSLADLYPHYRGAIGPASINLHIGNSLLYWPDWVRRSPRQDQSRLWRTADLLCPDEHESAWVMRPGLRYLAATAERLCIPDDHAGQLSARSSWGRDGLAVICGPAGYLDPGYEGHPTLELSVTGSELILWPGASICQLVVHRLDRAAEHPYGSIAGRSKYQHDREPTASRLFLDGGPS